MSFITNKIKQSKIKGIIATLSCNYKKLLNPIQFNALKLISDFNYKQGVHSKFIFNSQVRKLSNKHDNNISDKKPHRPLFLMQFDERIWPHPLKTLKNIFFTYLIRKSIDVDFDAEEFIKGSQMAICTVSDNISRGNFDEIEDLVSRNAISEIKKNYEELDQYQREFIRINPDDLFLKFIYEIGMIFDDNSS